MKKDSIEKEKEEAYLKYGSLNFIWIKSMRMWQTRQCQFSSS